MKAWLLYAFLLLCSLFGVGTAQAQQFGAVNCQQMKTTTLSATSALVANGGVGDGVRVCGYTVSAAAASVVTLTSCASGATLVTLQLAAGTTQESSAGYRGLGVPAPDAICATASTTAIMTVTYEVVSGAAVTAGVDCNFQTSVFVNCGLTTVRASEGTVVDSSGSWAVIPAGQPRISNLGILVEGTRTNGIRNNTMVGAAAGSPGTRPTNWAAFTLAGLTQTIVGTSSVQGTDCIDIRVNGTTNATSVIFNFEANNGIAAVNAQVWAESVFVQLVGGALTNVTATQLAADMRDSGGADLATLTATATTPTATLTRTSVAFTLNNASTAFVLPQYILTVNNAAAVDVTLRFCWPQMELGAYATSPIRTSSVAVVRAGDAVTVSNFFQGLYNPNAGTLFAYGVVDRTSLVNQVYADIGVGSAANEIIVFLNGTPRQAFVVASGGAGQASLLASTFTVNVPFKIAGSYAVNNFRMAADGIASAPDVSGVPPVSPTLFMIGARAVNTIPADSYVRRVMYFPFAMNDAQLRVLTAP